MRIGGMSFEQLYMMSRTKSKMTNAEKNFDPSKYGEPGMYVTEQTDWKKIIPVSDDIRNNIINHTRKTFVENFGMSDPDKSDRMSGEVNRYAMSQPVENRASAVWTLNRIEIEEANRLVDIVRKHDPTWKHGEPFDPSIFGEYFSSTGFDKRV